MDFARRSTLLANVLACVLSLQGCSSGGNDSSSAPASPAASGDGAAVGAAEEILDVDVTGSVGDGPIIDAQITVFSKTGETIGASVSDQSAGYNVQIRTKGKHYPLVLEARGGIDLVTNLPPDFTLFSSVTEPRRNAIANINPFTTVAIETARRMSGGATTTNIETAVTTVVRELNCGLVSLLDPRTTRVDDANLAEMVKASETLAEILRRANAVMLSARGDSSVDRVITAIASDLVDGLLDGRGGPNSDRHVSAVTRIVSAQVLIESMTNTLHVDGQPVAAQLDAIIDRLASGPSPDLTASMPITAQMIESAQLGVSAALAISPTDALRAVDAALEALTPGMLPGAVGGVLPSDAEAGLDPAIARITAGLEADIEVVNSIRADDGAPPGPNSPPIIQGSPQTSVVAGASYDFMPSASDPDNDPLVFTISNRPGWASFDPASGRLSGTPDATQVGSTSNIVIGVSDGQDAAALPPFEIEVASNEVPPPPNSPPVISGTPPSAVLQDTQYVFSPNASDPDGDALIFSITNLPAWANFDVATGQLAGTPGAGDIGTYDNIVVTVSDGQASSSLPPFSIVVNAVALGAATLNWTPPTTNADGSPLNDLAGYRFLWGTTLGTYPNSVVVNNPGISSYTIENLVPGTYYFVGTAIDSVGNESSFSNVAQKTIP